MTTITRPPLPTDKRVRVWFGVHVIADYTGEPAAALRYQAAMSRRFASLRVTIEPATGPLLLGYARRDLYLSDPHIEDMKQELKAIANLEGYTMGPVYVEDPASAPAAFDALIESVHRDQITTVLLPEWRHLALLGDPATIKQQFERVTGAHFLLYEPAP